MRDVPVSRSSMSEPLYNTGFRYDVYVKAVETYMHDGTVTFVDRVKGSTWRRTKSEAKKAAEQLARDLKVLGETYIAGPYASPVEVTRPQAVDEEYPPRPQVKNAEDRS